MNITREQIVEVARSYVGTPYKAGGSTREDGLNCAGLFVAVARDLGYLTEEIAGFSSFNEAEPLQKWFEHYFVRLESFEDALPGDAVSMFRTQETEGQHCAFLSLKSEKGIKYSYVIHALRNHGTVEGRLHGAYLRGVADFWRFKGLNEDAEL